MFNNDLNKYDLPDILTFENGKKLKKISDWAKRRSEIIKILKKEIYGFPPPPAEIDYKIKMRNKNAFAGKAIHSKVEILVNTPGGEFSFPVNLIMPKKVAVPPLILHIAFRPNIPDKYFPVEEIIDNGFATASFCYQDVAPDTDDDFKNGLASMYKKNKRSSDDWGKISLWSWAAQRVMDYLQTIPKIDTNKIAVAGHSRLGKTALWCAALDERFAVAVSNCSGCSGAALSRRKKGERIRDIINQFPYWFCENYKKYINNEEKMPFDQHFLLAAIAPRAVYVGSAYEDSWADPKSEYLSCVAANKIYDFLGLKGIEKIGGIIKPPISLMEGNIAYKCREGTHFFSRDDWLSILIYLKKHFKL